MTAGYRLRVLLVVPAYEPAFDYGGPVAKVGSLARELRGLGHQVEVWSSDFGIDRGRTQAGRRVLDGVAVRYFRRLLAYRWSAIAPGVYPAALRISADVAHCFGVRDGLTTLAAAGFRASRMPYLVEPMGMQSPIAGSRNRVLKSFYDCTAGRGYLAGSQGLVVTSERERASLSGSTAAALPTWIRPNPVSARTPAVSRDGARLRLKLHPDGFVIVWMGRVSRTKALPVLVRAMELVERACLVVCGPDDRDGAAAELDVALRQSSARRRVHRWPAMWGSDKELLLAAADVFVQTSHTESFGNAAAEAACAGLPVVVSSGCGIAPLIGRYGAGLVADVTPEAIGTSLRALRDSEGLRRKCSRGGKQLALYLSPGSVAEQQISIYEHLLSGPSRARDYRSLPLRQR